jgi:predicted anti-sigma-YlaC factor YlaD
LDCKATTRIISAYLDGEIKHDKAIALSEHIASCQSCQREIDAINRTMEVMGVCAEIEPAFTLADIRELAAQPSRVGSLWLGQLMRPATAAVVLVTLVLGSGSGVYYGTHTSSHRASPVVSREKASSSIGLDAFDDGLLGAVFVADAKAATIGEVRQ